MIKRAKLTFVAVALVAAIATSSPIYANSRLDNAASLFSTFDSTGNLTKAPTNGLFIKRGEKYDETKDPALRRGTENTEQPQSSFFAIPAIVLGIIGVVLFLSREK